MSTDQRFERLRCRLDAEVASPDLTLGAQAAVITADGSWSYETGERGLGQPMSADSLFVLYCAAKPVVAVGFLQLVERELVTLETPVGDVLDYFKDAGKEQITFRHLLHHTAGLHMLDGPWVAGFREAQRKQLVATCEPPPGWQIGVDVSYCEFAAWHLLGWSIEALTAEGLSRHLRRAVLEPCGMNDTYVGMSDADYDRVLDRIGLNHDMTCHPPMPMLGERGRNACTRVNPAYGVYGTAHDLARLYSALLDALAGRSEQLLQRRTAEAFIGDRRGARYDLSFGAVLDYGLGCMVELSSYQFGPDPSPNAFGHTGFMGTTLAFADPDHDIAAAVVFNGIVDRESALGFRRPSVVHALYQDLEPLVDLARS